MDNLGLTLIIITNFFLVLILGLLAFLVYRLFKQQAQSKKSEGTPDSDSPFHPGILQRMKELQNFKNKKSDLFCPNHPDEPGEVTCAICDRLFCKSCVKPFKTLHFCKEHLPLVMRHEWEEVLTVKTSTQDPEEGVRLYDAKKRLYEEKSIPTYVETHYKINVDHDYIETYLVVFSIKENMQLTRDFLLAFESPK